MPFTEKALHSQDMPSSKPPREPLHNTMPPQPEHIPLLSLPEELDYNDLFQPEIPYSTLLDGRNDYP